jgi:hypothetical protein
MRLWDIDEKDLTSVNNNIVDENDLWVVEYQHYNHSFDLKPQVHQLAVLADGTTLLSMDNFGRMKLWDTRRDYENEALVGEIRTDINGYSALHVLPDGVSIVVGEDDTYFSEEEREDDKPCRVQMWRC